MRTETLHTSDQQDCEEEKMAETPIKIYSSSEEVDIPFCDLLSWTFGNTDYDLSKPLFVDAENPERSLSHETAKSTIRRLIAGLKNIGVRPGDTVCFHATNDIYYAVVFLAVVGAGGRFLGTNPNYTSSELKHLFTTAEVRYVIAEDGHMASVEAAWDELGLDINKIFAFDTFADGKEIFSRSWQTLLQHGEQDWNTFDDEHTCKNTIACLMSTSGTTGLAKAAQSSHYAQIANCVIIQEKEKTYEVSRLLCLPQYHAFNLPLSLLLPIREGITLYVMKKYDLEAFLSSLRTFRPTETTLVNPIVFKLLDVCAQDRDVLSSLRQVSTGGVRLPQGIQSRFMELLSPLATLRQVYGMTEIGWAITLKHPEIDTTGAAGKLLPQVEARLVNDDGKDVLEESITGEILLRTPAIMLGYLNNETETNHTIVNGWIHTGDIAYHKEGKWYIVDRMKEIIKVRGWQVSPTEIEQCLLTHPAIVDVTVIGVDNGDHRGELPRAYIVIKPLLDVTNEDIKDFLKDKLIYYKWLSGGVRRKSILPRNSAGKLLKNILRAEAREEHLKKQMSAPLPAEHCFSDDKENLDNPKESSTKTSVQEVCPITIQSSRSVS